MVIATVFLTIIGMTVGFVLGERHRDDQANPGETTGVLTDGPTKASVSGPLCPAEIRQTAVLNGYSDSLRQVLKIVTENGTTVWICADPAGSLYYEGKTGGDSPIIEHTNALFLANVFREAPDHYKVYDQKKDLFDVTRETLTVQFASGKVETSKVIQAE